MKYYRADLRNAEIETVNIDRVERDHVIINGTPFAFEQVGFMYFPSKEEAREHLSTYFHGIYEGLQKRLQFTNEKLEKIKSL